ncbi:MULTISPECIES: hypothetical protein [unclassified Mycolicibacterium]|uniref:hypothetical protein n=1 Tax=unclassified Mycolicibacterium TaxID=2636767 RepID=UPI002ED7EA33
MSWLLVALVPALLMLVAVGLGRLENWLATERPAGRRDTLNGLQRRLASRDGDRLPTRVYSQHATNPGFHTTRHANRV